MASRLQQDVDARPRSPLELIHPRGFARRSCVLGARCPESLRPASDTDGPYDLIVVALPASALLTGSAERALALVTTALEAEGLAYVLAPRLGRRRLRRAIVACGLRTELEVVHLPNSTSSLVLAPLEPAVVRYALDEFILLHGWKRRAAAIMASRPRAAAAALSPLGLVVRRRGSSPSFEWLPRLTGTAAASVVISRLRPAGAGSFVVHGFGRGDARASLVAKIVPVAEATLDRESSTLVSGAAVSARAAGANVPGLLGSGTLGNARVLVLERLDGHLAATLLARSPERFEDVLGRITRWLVEWGRITARTTRLESASLDDWILRPARLLAAAIDPGGAYVARLEHLCAEASGQEVVITAAHNDLSMWNVVVANDGRIGVVDWEAASTRSLPLVDFYYAAVDATAATRGYADRLRAFTGVFGDASVPSGRTAELESIVLNGLSIDRTCARLAFHACWLHHAVNELQRSGVQSGPFVRIVQSIAGMDKEDTLFAARGTMT
jgi:hypothetical protein